MILVAGAGGAIGGALVEDLVRQGCRVRAVDVKPPEHWQRRGPGVEELVADLRDPRACAEATAGARDVYNFAADMGGMGFIAGNKALCMLSVLINTNLLDAARSAGSVERYFFASSACVYPQSRQSAPGLAPLRESDAYPADPEDGYGWEKLFSERMCRHFSEDFGLTTRVVRLHNVYGPHSAWTGGREKAPAAICRKIAEASISGRSEIEVWGSGSQTRSFTFIDDCVYGVQAIMASDIDTPINLGSAEMVSIDELVELVAEIAGIKVEPRYLADAPTGVAGRNSDNTMIRERLGWEPTTPLRDGLAATYAWVHEQVLRTGVSPPPPPTVNRQPSTANRQPPTVNRRGGPEPPASLR